MRINPTATNYILKNNSVKKNDVKNNKNSVNINPSFKSVSVSKIEQTLYDYYKIKAELGNNKLVAESILRTAEIIRRRFGKNRLPDIVKFVSFNKEFPEYKRENSSTLGLHLSDGVDTENELYFNSDLNCYKSENKLDFAMKVNRLKNGLSTGNYLHPFVHEFAHAAHYKNLCEKNKQHMMHKYHSTKLPSKVWRFISAFYLSFYSNTNLNELVAEKLTKDILRPYEPKPIINMNDVIANNMQVLLGFAVNEPKLIAEIILSAFVNPIYNGDYNYKLGRGFGGSDDTSNLKFTPNDLKEFRIKARKMGILRSDKIVPDKVMTVSPPEVPIEEIIKFAPCNFYYDKEGVLCAENEINFHDIKNTETKSNYISKPVYTTSYNPIYKTREELIEEELKNKNKINLSL